MLSIKFELDKSETLKSQGLLDCLAEEPIVQKQFNTLNLSHQNYFHRYIYTAKGLYPNPTKGNLHISLNANMQVRISNLLGNTLFARNFVEGDHLIDLSEFDSGVYFLLATDQSEEAVFKIIVE